MNRQLLLALCSFVLFANCTSEPPPPASLAFYHWQTALQLAENERLYLDSLGVKKLYVKFFDVDWDEASGQPVPLAQVEIDTSHLAGLEIVPTIFITNRTFLNLPGEAVDSLAGRIFQKIEALKKQAAIQANEVQFDCDWSEQTREKFFRLLEAFRSKSDPSRVTKNPKPQITATIRLHQFKFPEKTGVPPVDRGMLMFYNTGNLEAWQTENSILDLDAAQAYLPTSKISYPMPLDVALPLFRWGVLFRDGEMIKLVNDLNESDLRDTARFEKLADQRFAVRKSTYLQGYYLYAGDLIRLENVSQERLEQAVEMLAGRFSKKEKGSNVFAFYHLEPAVAARFPAANLKRVIEKW